MIRIPGFSQDCLARVQTLLYEEAKTSAEEEKPGVNCKPKPKPRSTEQRQATQQAQQAAQQQGQTFDQQPQQQVQELGRQGGQAERKTPLPECTK